MSKYVLTSGKHSRFEDGEPVIYKAGDVVELTADEAAALAGRIEPVEAAPEPEPAPKPKGRGGRKKKG